MRPTGRPGKVAALLALAVSLLLPRLPAAAESLRLRVELGKPFPDMVFDALLGPGDYASLGLKRASGPVRLSEVPGEILVLEFFNQYCLACRRQAPYLEKLYRRAGEKDLAGRVRLLAVGVGNRAKDLGGFRRDLGVHFPMTADPQFEHYLELGEPGGTPFTVFLFRDGAGWLLADYHLGVQDDTELLARTRVLLEGRTDVARLGRATSGGHHHPPLGLSENEQEGRVRNFLSRVVGSPVGVRPLELPGPVRLYEALTPRGEPMGLYARIASRDPVCNVCHAVHFMFAFDGKGTVRGFEPIHVTKYGNELWSAKDTARMASRLEGRKLADLAFDPGVDAVSTATMSSALIFDEIRRSAALLKEVKQAEPPSR